MWVWLITVLDMGFPNFECFSYSEAVLCYGLFLLSWEQSGRRGMRKVRATELRAAGLGQHWNQKVPKEGMHRDSGIVGVLSVLPLGSVKQACKNGQHLEYLSYFKLETKLKIVIKKMLIWDYDWSNVINFHGNVLVAGGLQAVRSCQKLPLYLIEAMSTAPVSKELQPMGMTHVGEV